MNRREFIVRASCVLASPNLFPGPIQSALPGEVLPGTLLIETSDGQMKFDITVSVLNGTGKTNSASIEFTTARALTIYSMALTVETDLGPIVWPLQCDYRKMMPGNTLTITDLSLNFSYA